MKKLNAFAIVILILFDIYVVFQLGIGMAYQGSSATRPEIAYPYWCTDLTRPGSLETPDASKNIYSQPGVSGLSTECGLVADAISKIRSDNAYVSWKQKDDAIVSEISSIQQDISRYEAQHTKYVQEKGAGLTDDEMISLMPESIKSDYVFKKNALREKEASRQSAFSTLRESDSWKNFKAVTDSVSKKVTEGYAHARYWYPVFVGLFQLLLILPLLAISLFAHSFLRKREKTIPSAFAQNLFFITVAYAFWILAKFAYWLFPGAVFKKIFEFLNSIGLNFIWNWLMLIGIGGILLVSAIYSQKVVVKWKDWSAKKKAEKDEQDRIEAEIKMKANEKKIWTERMFAGKCWKCGEKFISGKHCVCCGARNLKDCGTCGKEVPEKAPYCQHCGSANQ